MVELIQAVADTVRVVQTDTAVRIATIVMPFLLALVAGAVSVAGYVINYRTKQLELGQKEATRVNEQIGASAEKASTAAAVMVATVRDTSSEQLDGIRSLIVQGGKIHDLVNSNLTAYKRLVVELAESDEANRVQLRELGVKPTAPRVQDVRLEISPEASVEPEIIPAVDEAKTEHGIDPA